MCRWISEAGYLYVNDAALFESGLETDEDALDRYECRHGLGSTKILGAKNGIEVELLLTFVPPGEKSGNLETTVAIPARHRKISNCSPS